MDESSKVAKRLPGPIDLAKEAWVIYKKRFWTLVGIGILGYIGIFLLILIALGLGAGLFFLLGGKFQLSVLVIGFLLGLAVLTAVIYASTWLTAAILVTLRDWDKSGGIKENVKTSKAFILPLLGTSLVSGLIILGASFLFIIPAIIFSIWFTYANYVVIVDNRAGLNALHTSREYIRGRFWGVIWRAIAIHLPEIIIAIIIGYLGGKGESQPGVLFRFVTILAIPFYQAYNYLIFKHLRDTAGKVEATVPSGNKRVYILVPILGLLLAVLAGLFVIPQAVRVFSTWAPKLDEYERMRKGVAEVKPGTIIVNGLIQYYSENNEYPDSLQMIEDGGYMDAMQTSMLQPGMYRYTRSQDGQDFRLCTPVTVNPEKCVTSRSNSFDL